MGRRPIACTSTQVGRCPPACHGAAGTHPPASSSASANAPAPPPPVLLDAPRFGPATARPRFGGAEALPHASASRGYRRTAARGGGEGRRPRGPAMPGPSPGPSPGSARRIPPPVRSRRTTARHRGAGDAEEPEEAGEDSCGSGAGNGGGESRGGDAAARCRFRRGRPSPMGYKE